MHVNPRYADDPLGVTALKIFAVRGGYVNIFAHTRRLADSPWRILDQGSRCPENEISCNGLS